jgi:hypothetical protein
MSLSEIDKQIKSVKLHIVKAERSGQFDTCHHDTLKRLEGAKKAEKSSPKRSGKVNLIQEVDNG